MNNLRRQPLDVVTACRLKDLPVLKLAAQNLRRFVPLKQLHVLTARQHFAVFRRELGPEVALIGEDNFIPDMTLAGLRALNEPGFPQGAGWYFQQFLKFNFAFHQTDDDHYLIWDADTVPLRPMEFFDDAGRMVFTTAEEYHAPYFQTYARLLRQEAHREFSFISQHIIVRKSILREMLRTIEQNFEGPENWAWKIMRHLAGTGTNRFSEYETYGHYVKNVHPAAAAFRQLPWLRDGSRFFWGLPTASGLERLGNDYAFAAFEARQRFFERVARRLKGWLPGRVGAASKI